MKSKLTEKRLVAVKDGLQGFALLKKFLQDALALWTDKTQLLLHLVDDAKAVGMALHGSGCRTIDRSRLGHSDKFDVAVSLLELRQHRLSRTIFTLGLVGDDLPELILGGPLPE